jgi:hypothetical protein
VCERLDTSFCKVEDVERSWLASLTMAITSDGSVTCVCVHVCVRNCALHVFINVCTCVHALFEIVTVRVKGRHKCCLLPVRLISARDHKLIQTAFKYLPPCL